MRNTYQDLMRQAAEYRGQIINEVIWIEKMVDIYISSHFCKRDKSLMEEMHILLLGDNRIAFDNKRQIFHAIAMKHDDKWYDSYKDNSGLPKEVKTKTAGAFNNALCYLIEQRNVLAHCLLDTTKEAKYREDEKIKFFRFKNEISEFEFTPELLSGIHMLILDMNVFLGKRIGSFRDSPSNPFSVDSLAS